ncbi:RNA-directed DNA polymerase, eukaryota [Tanacetum coccineum]
MVKFVEQVWNDYQSDDSNAMLRFMNKLKFLKTKLRSWTNTKKESLTYQNTKLKSTLIDIDKTIDAGYANSDLLNNRKNVMTSLLDMEKIKSLEVAQKAKIKWSIEGDENSKFFHGILNKKRNNLAIRGILVDGVWIDSPSMVKDEFLSHFKNRFDCPSSTRLFLDMNFPNQISSEVQVDLEKDVSLEELKRAVWDCGMDKSPGPDGFTFGFYRRYWSLLEKDVIEAVSYFFQHGSFPKGGNSSFIALIPKSQNANMVKDFRPISLIGSLYKIIAKIMANRLVGVLEDIVSDVQSAFVAVDFEKAFDSVRWDYLDEVLKKFGFGDRWCGWIHSCLRSSRGSILVNGSPTKEFQFHKGLKQGDPLSPFLFILIMESLHLSFQNVVNAVLKCFFCESGLSINMHKSKLMGIDVDDDKVNQAAHLIGCLQLKSPFSYLGSRIGGSMSRINSWDDIVNKLLARLSKWKMKTLSIGGHLTLLKSVLVSIAKCGLIVARSGSCEFVSGEIRYTILWVFGVAKLLTMGDEVSSYCYSEVFRNTLLDYETSKGSNGNIGLPNGFKDNDLVSVRSTSNKAKVLLINGGHSVSPNKASSSVAMSLKESISSANVRSCNRCPKEPNRCRDNKVDSSVCCNELERVYQQCQCAAVQQVIGWSMWFSEYLFLERSWAKDERFLSLLNYSANSWDCAVFLISQCAFLTPVNAVKGSIDTLYGHQEDTCLFTLCQKIIIQIATLAAYFELGHQYAKLL